MESLIEQLKTLALTQALPFFMKLGAAIVLWFVGRSLIAGFQRVLNIALNKRKLDATLIRYTESLFSGAFTILLLLALLGMMGIETTSFAALLAAAGIAIGSAWSGLLSNFAAGVFLLVLRPFRVGDSISSGGVAGTVHEVGLFVTSIETPDNLRITVGNSRLLGDNIVNYSHHATRQVAIKVPLRHGADVAAIKRALEERVAAVPGVLAQPALSVGFAEFTVKGPVLMVQAWCPNASFGPVSGGMGEAIAEALILSGYAAPQGNAAPQIAKAG